VFTHQEHVRREPVPTAVRKEAKHLCRSIKRGLPGRRLKDAFPFASIAGLVKFARPEPFDPACVTHVADVLIVACWFMLREIELAGAFASQLKVSGPEVELSIPIHKMAQGGQPVITRRVLRCACGVRLAPLCPAHAASRHLARLAAGPGVGPGCRLFPAESGQPSTKRSTVQALTAVLQAAGIRTHTEDHRGRRVAIFGGHLARVSGAQFLAANGIPIATVQLLGRWSSKAVEKYTQAAPLALAPVAPAMALGNLRAPGLAGDPGGMGR
jgi:hypothetical protein